MIIRDKTNSKIKSQKMRAHITGNNAIINFCDYQFNGQNCLKQAMYNQYAFSGLFYFGNDASADFSHNNYASNICGNHYNERSNLCQIR